MKKCPFCAEDIQDAANVCKHCGRDLPAQQAAKAKDTAIGCFLLLAIVAGCSFWLSRKSDTPEAQQKRADSDARVAVTTLCEREMTARLRSPGSADYPWDHVGKVQNIGGNRYRLQSYVDAQNAFGALIRTNFVCTAEGSGAELDGYKVVDFSAIER